MSKRVADRPTALAAKGSVVRRCPSDFHPGGSRAVSCPRELSVHTGHLRRIQACVTRCQGERVVGARAASESTWTAVVLKASALVRK